MARDINRRSWNKKINPHLTGSKGIDRGKKRGEKNGPRILSTNLPWEQARVERMEAQTPQSLAPHQHVRLHDLGVESAQGYSYGP
jgi:hypothetical protein